MARSDIILPGGIGEVVSHESRGFVDERQLWGHSVRCKVGCQILGEIRKASEGTTGLSYTQARPQRERYPKLALCCIWCALRVIVLPAYSSYHIKISPFSCFIPLAGAFCPEMSAGLFTSGLWQPKLAPERQVDGRNSLVSDRIP